MQGEKPDSKYQVMTSKTLSETPSKKNQRRKKQERNIFQQALKPIEKKIGRDEKKGLIEKFDKLKRKFSMETARSAKFKVVDSPKKVDK